MVTHHLQCATRAQWETTVTPEAPRARRTWVPQAHHRALRTPILISSEQTLTASLIGHLQGIRVRIKVTVVSSSKIPNKCSQIFRIKTLTHRDLKSEVVKTLSSKCSSNLLFNAERISLSVKDSWTIKHTTPWTSRTSHTIRREVPSPTTEALPNRRTIIIKTIWVINSRIITIITL